MTIRTIRPQYVTARDFERYRAERRKRHVSIAVQAAAFVVSLAFVVLMAAAFLGGCDAGVVASAATVGDASALPAPCDKTDPRFARLILNNAVCAGEPTTYAPIPSGTCANTVGAPLVGCTVTDGQGRALWVCVETCQTDGGGQ